MSTYTHITHKCELYASGNIKSSVCVEINGKRDGQYIHYYTNGKNKSISNYINDKLEKEKEDDHNMNDENVLQNYCVIC